MDRQCVHVCPKTDGTGFIANLQYADHPGFTNTSENLNTERFKLPGHEIGRSVFVEAQFRVSVYIPSPLSEFVLRRYDISDQRHA
jgi:hypothetical protein